MLLPPRVRTAPIVLCLLALIGAPSWALALPYSFVEIASDVTDGFVALGKPAINHDGTVVFYGERTSGEIGIWSGDGTGSASTRVARDGRRPGRGTGLTLFSLGAASECGDRQAGRRQRKRQARGPSS